MKGELIAETIEATTILFFRDPSIGIAKIRDSTVIPVAISPMLKEAGKE